MLEKLDNKVQKNKVGILHYIMHQNELKMNERSRHKTRNSKTIRKREKLLGIRFGNDFLNTTQKHRQQKQKETMGLHQTEKLLSIKRNNQ